MIDWIVGLLQRALAYVGAFFAGKLHEQKERAEDDAKAMHKEAQRQADAAGATVDDAIVRLRFRSIAKRAERDKRRN